MLYLLVVVVTGNRPVSELIQSVVTQCPALSTKLPAPHTRTMGFLPVGAVTTIQTPTLILILTYPRIVGAHNLTT